MTAAKRTLEDLNEEDREEHSDRLASIGEKTTREIIALAGRYDLDCNYCIRQFARVCHEMADLCDFNPWPESGTAPESELRVDLRRD